jgi:glutamate N-acetyltransferase/amino-acid N-acetyltransferase
VIINSGCANAVTGKGGLEDATNMAAKVDEYTGVPEAGTLVMSTGVIGQRYVFFQHIPSLYLQPN